MEVDQPVANESMEKVEEETKEEEREEGELEEGELEDDDEEEEQIEEKKEEEKTVCKNNAEMTLIPKIDELFKASRDKVFKEKLSEELGNKKNSNKRKHESGHNHVGNKKVKKAKRKQKNEKSTNAGFSTPDFEEEMRQYQLAREGKLPSSSNGSKKMDALCVNFVEGNCPLGSRCQYSHDRTMATRKPLKLEVCKFYIADRCVKKISCDYMHKEFPCKLYHTGRKCGPEHECKYSHKSLSDVTRGILIKHLETAPDDILRGFRRLPFPWSESIVKLTEAKRNDLKVDEATLQCVRNLRGKGYKYVDKSIKSHLKKLREEAIKNFGEEEANAMTEVQLWPYQKDSLLIGEDFSGNPMEIDPQVPIDDTISDPTDLRLLLNKNRHNKNLSHQKSPQKIRSNPSKNRNEQRKRKNQHKHTHQRHKKRRSHSGSGSSEDFQGEEEEEIEDPEQGIQALMAKISPQDRELFMKYREEKKREEEKKKLEQKSLLTSEEDLPANLQEPSKQEEKKAEDEGPEVQSDDKVEQVTDKINMSAISTSHLNDILRMVETTKKAQILPQAEETAAPSPPVPYNPMQMIKESRQQEKREREEKERKEMEEKREESEEGAEQGAEHNSSSENIKAIADSNSSVKLNLDSIKLSADLCKVLKDITKITKKNKDSGVASNEPSPSPSPVPPPSSHPKDPRMRKSPPPSPPSPPASFEASRDPRMRRRFPREEVVVPPSATSAQGLPGSRFGSSPFSRSNSLQIADFDENSNDPANDLDFEALPPGSNLTSALTNSPPSLPFDMHQPPRAVLLDGSIQVHSPIPYCLAVVTVKLIDYTSFLAGMDDERIREDPRLHKAVHGKEEPRRRRSLEEEEEQQKRSPIMENRDPRTSRVPPTTTNRDPRMDRQRTDHPDSLPRANTFPSAPLPPNSFHPDQPLLPPHSNDPRLDRQASGDPRLNRSNSRSDSRDPRTNRAAAPFMEEFNPNMPQGPPMGMGGPPYMANMMGGGPMNTHMGMRMPMNGPNMFPGHQMAMPPQDMAMFNPMNVGQNPYVCTPQGPVEQSRGGGNSNDPRLKRRRNEPQASFSPTPPLY